MNLRENDRSAIWPCERCGTRMRLMNDQSARVTVYWCPACGRFQERTGG